MHNTINRGKFDSFAHHLSLTTLISMQEEEEFQRRTKEKESEVNGERNLVFFCPSSVDTCEFFEATSVVLQARYYKAEILGDDQFQMFDQH